jgi:DNA-binding NarL/FixJ family response regulator
MNPGLILYIEDSESQRKSLKVALELRGFNVIVAGDVATARAMLEKYQGQIDVVILDMRLEDPDWPQLTGADVAMEYYNPRTPYPPEFLIHSAHSELDYYKLALKLGVATYLEKSEYRQVDLIRHIRALVIRRALSVKNPATSNRVQKIIETSQNQSEAIELLCREELEPKFSGCLGAPFIFLLSDNDRTFCFSSEPGLPNSLDLYTLIQRMVFSDIRSATPFILDAAGMLESFLTSNEEVLHRLDGAAFVRLTLTENLQLSIGILRAGPHHPKPSEPPLEMATILSEHLEESVISLFLSVIKNWIAFRTEIETRRREVMKITSEVCLSVGREQALSLQRLASAFPMLSKHEEFNCLQRIVEDLRTTGTMLDSLSQAKLMTEDGFQKVTAFSLKDLIQSVWADMSIRNAGEVFHVDGDCSVRAFPADLSIVISSLLRWMAGRFIHTPEGIEPHISVCCRENQKEIEAIFEDRSERLNTALRERIFDLFAGGNHNEQNYIYSSMYVARVILENRYEGSLEEVSEEIAMDRFPSQVGHRFRIRLPKLPNSHRNTPL